MQKKSPRHLARSLAVQGLYYYKINQTTLIEIERYLNDHEPAVYGKTNYELLHSLLEFGISNFHQYLERYTPYLNRDITQVGITEQCILVIAMIEFLHNLSVPAAVIINEAVELAKLYGAPDSYKFINGLVDKLAHEVRRSEITDKIYQKT
jgi:transcription antitermination protein NusB